MRSTSKSANSSCFWGRLARTRRWIVFWEDLGLWLWLEFEVLWCVVCCCRDGDAMGRRGGPKQLIHLWGLVVRLSVAVLVLLICTISLLSTVRRDSATKFINVRSSLFLCSELPVVIYLQWVFFCLFCLLNFLSVLEMLISCLMFIDCTWNLLIYCIVPLL